MIPKIKIGDIVRVTRLSSAVTPPNSLGVNGEVLDIYKNPVGDGELATIVTKDHRMFVGVALSDIEFFEGSQIDAD
jgi:hypothetical protein